MKLLFIGNSHTFQNNLPLFVKEFCENSGVPTEVAMLAHGGRDFAFHVGEPEVHFNILYGGYDAVILQNHAHPMPDPEQMMESGKILHSWITEAGARDILFMPWTEEDNRAAQPKMAKSYLDLARATGASVAPAGIAWWKLMDACPDLTLYAQTNHATPAGTRLAAACIAAVLLEREPNAPDELGKIMTRLAMEAIREL